MAANGSLPYTFAHLLPESHEAEAPTVSPIVPKEMAAPVLPKKVPLKKELLVNTSTNDAPNTPALTDFPDLLVLVHKYRAYHCIE